MFRKPLRSRSAQNDHPVRARRRPLKMEGLEERTVLSTIGVTNLDSRGDGSLDQAIREANTQEGADTIEFAEGLDGTIYLQRQLSIRDDLTIEGPGADVLKISGGGSSRVFYIDGATVVINGLTIADGMATDLPGFKRAGGAGLANVGGDVTLNNVHVMGNDVQGYIATGGGAANYSEATMTVNDSTFTDNQALGTGFGYGGAIFNRESTLTVNGSSFSENTATAEFGLNPDVSFSGTAASGAIGGESGSSLTVTDSVFNMNVARAGDGNADAMDGGYALGGAITVSGQTKLLVTDSSFLDNQSIGGRGADGGVGVRGGNSGYGSGGAIASNVGSEVTVMRSEFTGNQAVAPDGGNGGAGADGGHSGVYGTWDGGVGGAISNASARLTIVDSHFTENSVRGGNGGHGGSGGNGGNSSDSAGGAIGVGSLGSLTPYNTYVDVSGTTFANSVVIAGLGGKAGEEGSRDGNDGNARGGALSAISLTGSPDAIFVNITDSMVSGNLAQGSGDAVVQGGGIYAAAANLTLANVDISDNKEVTDGVEIVIEGYDCDGILTEGNCAAPQQGDANRDGVVDFVDFLVLSANFGQEGDWSTGDFNLDGIVDFEDFLFLAENFMAANNP